jgi:tetratricopeptide (TPR) repeat protein
MASRVALVLTLLLSLGLFAAPARAQGGGPLPGAPNNAAADAYERGERLLQRGELESAAEEFDKAAKLAPLFHLAHFASGNALARAGKGREAEKRYRNTVAVAPRFAPGWNALGVVLLSQDRVEAAVKAFSRALRADPKHRLALLHRGEALVRSGRPEEGAKDARALLAKDPTNGDAHVVLASAEAAQGSLERAHDVLDTLFKSQPDHGPGLLLRASLRAQQDRYDEAAAALARAVERAGDQPVVRHQALRLGSRLADAARVRGETAAQVRVRETIVVLVPKSATAHARLGAALITLYESRPATKRDPREVERARKALERSLELDSSQEPVRKLLEMYRAK